MKLDTHELAWAAGFFDGEGHVSCRRDGQKVLKVQQSHDRQVLDRFQAAVGGIGSIKGPWTNMAGNPLWSFQVQKFEYVQAIVAMLWKYLSPVKKEQARLALTRSRNWARTI